MQLSLVGLRKGFSSTQNIMMHLWKLMENVVLLCWVYKYCLGIILAQTISDEGY